VAGGLLTVSNRIKEDEKLQSVCFYKAQPMLFDFAPVNKCCILSGIQNGEKKWKKKSGKVREERDEKQKKALQRTRPKLTHYSG
jgi:hypothetical protein